MPTDWVRRPGRVVTERFMLHFASTGVFGGGFSFECDKDGNVEPIRPEAEANWRKCQNLEGVAPGVVQDWSSSYFDHGSIRCKACQREVDLANDAVQCECGKIYGPTGQQYRDDYFTQPVYDPHGDY
jgi:hypothetical protein